MTCFLSPQISSFSVNPNYDIIFFSSEVNEIVNIVDFLHGRTNISVAARKVENFEVGGESNR